jgi:hypothetical protein
MMNVTLPRLAPLVVMNLRSRLVRCSLLVAALSSVATAARPRWHLEAGPSAWLGVDLSYGAKAAPDPSTAARTDRVYDDGFNRVDASGNLGDGASGPLASRTGYFGFNNDNQVNLQAGTLSLHRLQAADGVYARTSNPSNRPGVDVNLRASLASAAATHDWGVELGADFARFRQNSSDPVSTDVRLLTDTYALGGVVPQRAPYAGRFSPLPGDQRIGDTPTRTITTPPGTVSGSRSFRARTTLVRLGGWYEVLPGGSGSGELSHWSVLAHAGPALLRTRASFSVDEQVQAGGVSATSRLTADGSRSKTDWGAFGGLKARRSFGERCALQVWGDYLSGAKTTVSGGTRYAQLDLSSAWLLGLAVEVQFGR